MEPCAAMGMRDEDSCVDWVGQGAKSLCILKVQGWYIKGTREGARYE